MSNEERLGAPREARIDVVLELLQRTRRAMRLLADGEFDPEFVDIVGRQENVLYTVARELKLFK